MYYIQEIDKPNFLFSFFNIVKLEDDKIILPIANNEKITLKKAQKLAKNTNKILKKAHGNQVVVSKLIKNQEEYLNYLNSYNEEKGTHLAIAGKIHYEPLGLYPGKQSDLAAITDGAEIAVPNDTTNCARALLLLEAEGLIKLDPEAGITATENDIVENPHNIKIVPLAAEQVARTLEDVDFGVINGNYAMEAGLTSADAVALESADSEAIQQYVNVVAVKEGNENNEGVQALVKILKSDEIKDFINEKYDGAVIPFAG